MSVETTARASLPADGINFELPLLMRDLGRLLVFLGLALVAAGVVITFAGRTGVGRLPGDLIYRRGNFTLYVPLMTSILLSIALSLLFWLFRR